MNQTAYPETIAARMTAAEAVKEMEAALLAAKDDPEFRKAFQGRIPTVDEFILYCMMQILQPRPVPKRTTVTPRQRV